MMDFAWKPYVETVPWCILTFSGLFKRTLDFGRKHCQRNNRLMHWVLQLQYFQKGQLLELVENCPAKLKVHAKPRSCKIGRYIENWDSLLLFQLLVPLAAFTVCWQLWQHLLAVNSCNKLSTATAADTSCRNLWQLKQAVNSKGSMSKKITKFVH